MIRIGSLFSGYGGLDLAVQSVLGGEVAWHVEYDKAPSRILDHHFPGIPNYGDVTQLDFTTVEPVDVLTGGYPCQPFSHAGLRKGTDDDRHLWPHVLRAICEMGPRLAILENVRGHLSLGFGTVLADLASVGWSARWGIVRASDAGAPHQRARLFIVAYPDQGRRGGWWKESGSDLGRHDQINGEGRRESPEGRGWTPLNVLAYPERERHDGRGGPSAAEQAQRGRPDVAGLADSPADAQGDGRPQGWTGSGQRAGSTGQPASNLSPTADATGSEWRGAEQQHLGATPRPASEPRERAGSLADADLAGGKARRDTRHDGERIWVQPLGPAQPLANAYLAGSQGRQPAQGCDMSSWGDYGPAIAKWERVIGRPAPAPTESGRTGNPRLSPAFVEWMMGLPAGWVTDPAIGISRNDQLKALGNGVVPQQAALALDVLLKGTPNDLRQILATV